MSTIKVIIKNKEFNIPRELLTKFDFFEGLFAINPDDDITLDVDIRTFENLIDVIQGVDIIKNVGLLSDMLGFKEKNVMLNNYQCHSEQCSNYTSDSKFCELHTCALNGCMDERFERFMYCSEHICLSDNCNNYSDGINYCEMHSCSVEGCNKERIELSLVCVYHKCIISEKNKKKRS